MKRYAYKALNVSRQAVEGVVDVSDAKALDAFFLKNELIPIRIALQAAAAKERKKRGGFFTFGKKITQIELIAFTRQFAAAYGAGLSIAATLEVLAKQSDNKVFQKTLTAISQLIQGGQGLTQAFLAFPDFFDETYVAILRSGEVSGNLDKVLDYSAGLLEKKLVHKERIASTLLYPKIVVGMIGVTATVIVLYVIPQFAKMYDKFGAELPLPTRIMVAISHFGRDYWRAAVILVPFFFWAKKKLGMNKKFMLWLHERLLQAPIFGPTFLKIELAYFCTTFSLLLRSGVRITDAAQIAVDGMQNTYLRTQLGSIVPQLELGASLSGSLESVKVLPPLLSSMIRIGEEAGTLEGLLDRVAIMYEGESEVMLKRLPTMLEPVILAGLFVLVLGLALAVYLPMWKMASILKK
jgi:type II secretory pathway component PulF